ncbi:MAG: SAM-dependent methyltransferase [Ruminococcaceae bacterium]|nr:SAM-dependent methyltransferase [Oscillospiraceae bacterium]
MQYPEAFTERMKAMLGTQYPAFEKAFSGTQNHIGLRINRTCPGLEELICAFSPVPWCKNGYYANKEILNGKHPYHLAGLIYFQEPSAMSTVAALSIQPGDFVLDLCAAPGGKASQAGFYLSPDGFLVANEIVPKRAKILSENIQRCGFSHTVVTNEAPDRLEKKFPEFFDKIIVDAPCSGEGMFRKEPQAVEEWSIAHTESCAQRQLLILESALKMLRPGGCLVYSTCTFAPCENEGVIDKLLSAHSELSLLPISLPGMQDGCADWADSSYPMAYTKRIFPHLAQGEGHFVALLQKAGTPAPREMAQKKPGKNLSDAIKSFREFEKKTFTTLHEGCFQLFGEHLYLVPHGISLDGLRVECAGLYLGICKKGRFEPSHALALATPKESFLHTQNYPCDAPELLRFLSGETIPTEETGWTAVLADGFPIGWGKGSDGMLKNHIPKILRI